MVKTTISVHSLKKTKTKNKTPQENKQKIQTPPFYFCFHLYHSQNLILPVPQKQSTDCGLYYFKTPRVFWMLDSFLLLLTSYISWIDKISIKCWCYLFLIGFSYLLFVPPVSLQLLYTIN